MYGASGGVTTLVPPGYVIKRVADLYKGGEYLVGPEIKAILVGVDKVDPEVADGALQAYGFSLMDGPTGPEVSEHSPLVAR